MPNELETVKTAFRNAGIGLCDGMHMHYNLLCTTDS